MYNREILICSNNSHLPLNVVTTTPLDIKVYFISHFSTSTKSLMDMEKSALQTMVGFIFPKSDEVKDELYQVVNRLKF